MNHQVFLLVFFLIFPFALLWALCWPRPVPAPSRATAKIRSTLNRSLCPAVHMIAPSVVSPPLPRRVEGQHLRMSPPWSEVKSRHGARHPVNTQRFSCPNHQCAYFGIPNQGMNVSIRNPEVRVQAIGTGKTLSAYAFGSSSPALTSHQGRRGRDDGPTSVEMGEEWQHAGQSSGVRGLSCRRSLLRLAPSCEVEGRTGNQSRCQSSVRARKRLTMSRNTNT
jgi:hypothetical protein